MAQQSGYPVNVVHQRDVEIFTFVLTADQLVEVARVERFGESSDGVNRKYDEQHAIEIAEAMLKPDTVMLDSICGDLRGDWQVKSGKLVPGKGAFLSIDDGQHRLGACNVLNPEERERWSWPVVATKGLDYEQRLKIFRQQKLRKSMDSRLDLAQRHRLNDWNTDAERQAYLLVLQLDSTPNSPLKDMIILEETVRRPYEKQHRAAGVNANGLWASLKSVMSKRSPLYVLSVEKRAEVALNMIHVASEVWPKAWRSQEHVLTTARGINAVLSLIVSGPSFRMIIGEDFRVESLRAALELAAKFNWTVKAHRNVGQREMTLKLDAAIGNAYQRKLEAGGGNVQA